MLKFKKRSDTKYDITANGKKIGDILESEGFKPAIQETVKIWTWKIQGWGNRCYSTSLENCKTAVQAFYERLTA